MKKIVLIAAILSLSACADRFPFASNETANGQLGVLASAILVGAALVAANE